MSEKLDGIRAYWDGEKLSSRHGNRIYCPINFTENLPTTPLDGELWLGRGSFHKLTGLLNSEVKDDTWNEIKFVVFDLPNSKEPIETRISEMMTLSLPPHASILKKEQCK